MFKFDHSTRSSLPAELPSGMKGKLRALHLRSRNLSKGDSAPVSTQPPSYTESDGDRAIESYPSQVAWKSDNFQTSTLLPGTHVIGRSASSPLLSAQYQTDGYTQASSSSSHSLRLTPNYASFITDGYFVPSVKPLSPIAEQDYFSPDKQSMALPSEDIAASTPTGSQYSGIARPSPIYSTFITRPLNRSISQTSSRTQVSTSSAPPSIPPLDLRPPFSGHVNVPPLRMPKAAALRPMPTIAGSSEGYTGVCDDGSSLRAESFITAESVDPQSGSGGAGQESSRSGARNSRHSSGSMCGPCSRVEQASIPSIASQARSTRSSQSSSSTSFFDRRWRRSESFGSGLAIASFPKVPKLQLGVSLTPACWLFLLGFVAPWCWMIGGWYYTIRGQRRPKYGKKHGRKDLVPPMWVMTKKGLGGVRLTEKEAHSQGVWFGYPFVATAIDNDAAASSIGSIRSPPTIRTKRPKVLDPWIIRCRIAAFASGFLLLVGFIIAFVVIGHKYA